MDKKYLIPFLLSVVIFQGATRPLNPENNAVWHNSMGIECMEQGNVAKAIGEYKIAIALQPDKPSSAVFHNNLGMAYLRINKPNWATLCFENAISLSPNTLYFYDNLVTSYVRSGKLEEQYAYFRSKAFRDFKNPCNWLMLGLIQQRKGDYKSAIKSFGKFLSLEPELAISNAIKGRVEELKKFR